MKRADRHALERAAEVRRVRTEMETWRFPPREIEEEIERVRRLGLGPLNPHAGPQPSS